MKEQLIKQLTETLDREKIKYDINSINECIEYADKIYGDSKRHKGESTLVHSIKVATIVAGLKIGINPVYTAIMHEVTKFDKYNHEEVIMLFGEDVANMVKDGSQLYLLNYSGQEKIEAENLRKMFMAIAKDIRVVIIRLADRLYNMRNIFEEEIEIQKLKAKETMQVYAPIAHRLGMSGIKSELEDISFSILHPLEFENIKNGIEKIKEERQEHINLRIEEIRQELNKENIVAKIYGRPKAYHSIYRKMIKYNCSIDGLYDLYAVRIIVNSIKDCYTALGIIHEKYKPMPGRFKDYIAVPKTNMYQSLHTTVFGADNSLPFEVQIRTWDMHNVADYGVAAHFLYKEGKTKSSSSDEKLTWLRKTIELEKEYEESGEDYNQLKTELFGDEVFVFTPKGEIKSLPKGATPIDFAYLIHQHIGNSMVGAKINGKMVPITTKLKNTDIVEVVTSKTAKGPNLDWLKHVKTTAAKNKIVSYMKKQDKEVNVERGEELFEKELAKQKIEKEDLLKEKYIKVMLERYNLNNIESAYENLGFGVLSAKKLVNKLVEEYSKEHKAEIEKIVVEKQSKEINKKSKNDTEGIIVEGIDNCLVKLAKCCSPLPGDEIIGYISIGKGVSVHRVDCKNLTSLNINERKINVKWKEKAKVSYQTMLRIKANDRTGVAMDVLAKVQDNKIPVMNFIARQTTDNECIIEITVNIDSVEQLQKLMKDIRKVDSVFDVRRAK